MSVVKLYIKQVPQSINKTKLCSRLRLCLHIKNAKQTSLLLCAIIVVCTLHKLENQTSHCGATVWMQHVMYFEYKYRGSVMMAKRAAADSLLEVARAILTLHYALVTVYLKIVTKTCLKFRCWKNFLC